MKLLEGLTMYGDPVLVELIAVEKVRLSEELLAARHTESLMEKMEKERDERFE